MARREHMERAGTNQFTLASMDMTRDCLFSMRKVRLFAGPYLSIPLMEDNVLIGPALDGIMSSPL
jgi:hypothetical protein